MTDFGELKAQIESKAKAARKEGQYVDIDFMLPSVAIHRGPDDELYYQERAAQDLLDQFRPQAEMFHVSLKDVILSAVQEW